MLSSINPAETPAWQKLILALFMNLQATHLRELFHEDPQRFQKFKVQFEDILVDYSKNIINQGVVDILIELAHETELPEAIKAMFEGVPINQTERRAVLHTALRNRANTPVLVNGKDVMPDINKVLDQMKNFSDQLLQGQWKGYTGKPITDIVNIGIGGSDLGPLMVTEALKPYHRNIRPHFVSNVDGTHMAETVKQLDAETTLSHHCLQNLYHPGKR